VNVYTPEGRMVRADVPADQVLDNLPKGIYIVNGKKMVKK
jgi:hypothetical protein